MTRPRRRCCRLPAFIGRLHQHRGAQHGEQAYRRLLPTASAGLNATPETLPTRESLAGGVVLSRTLALDASAADVWDILKDPEKVVTCIPGARLEGPPRGRDSFQGVCDVSVGPMGAAFRGTAASSADR